MNTTMTLAEIVLALTPQFATTPPPPAETKPIPTIVCDTKTGHGYFIEHLPNGRVRKTYLPCGGTT